MSESFARLLLILVPAAPLAAAVLTALVGPSLPRGRSHWPCVIALAISFVASAGLLFGGLAVNTTVATGYQWLHAGGFDVSIDLRADAMTALMLVTVTFVSLLVAVYSSGYLHDDDGYARYFAEVALFVFSMCMLVLADNLLVLFIFWEAVGLCSYLLIGFWFRQPAAAAAAKKAFVVNRVGDFAFLIGLFLIWTTFGTLEMSTVLNEAAIDRVAAGPNGPALITMICLLLFAGAAGKSAQFPLHVWLPDAMEGPTPVSALIHAATMVTAGVYLVARCTPLFMHAPEAQLVVAGVGAFTALLAALIALTQNDLKRVLAYSTVSQLGYMFLALGAGVVGEKYATAAVTAAMFHLFTHAFFKALLFLGAGSVMHAMGGVIDMRRFGGLWRLMPYTHATFVCGAAALAGAPLLAGFWSKDEILAVVAKGADGGPYATYFLVLLATATVTAVLTAFYIFRAYFLTFWGPERFPRSAGEHVHESPPVMTGPLVVLATFAVLAGLIFGPTGWFAAYLERTPGLPPAQPHHIDWAITADGTIAALIGFAIAVTMYMAAQTLPERLGRAAGPLHPLSYNRFYVDQLLTALFVSPVRWLGWLGDKLDRHFIDRVVELVGIVPRLAGRGLRPIQDGLVPSYTLVMAFGVAVLIVSLMVMQ
ncbi:MAG: NADH-quinone oxidoreductase subunit L [Planctomycetaceae bacterium]